MSDKTTTRRQVIRACGAACLSATAATASADEAAAKPQSESMETAESFETGGRSGIYQGTVDRVVDGEHVVVLVESGEQPWQVVFARERVPGVEERDTARVWLWRGTVLRVWID